MTGHTLGQALQAAVVLLPVLIAAAVSGCAAPAPDPGSRIETVEREFDIPPRQMLEIVQEALRQPPNPLAIESVAEGAVVTDWERHRGDFHIARHWQERTRYRVTVIPDWEEPTRRSRVQVLQETEQRRAEGQTWSPAPGLGRKERAENLLERIAAFAEQRPGTGSDTRQP